MMRLNNLQQLRRSLISLVSTSSEYVVLHEGILGSSSSIMKSVATQSSITTMMPSLTSLRSSLPALPLISRSIHHSSLHLNDDTQTPPPITINPLQQTPSPTTQQPSSPDDTTTPSTTSSPLTTSSLYAKAILRGVAIGPRKLNLFAKVIRGLHIEDALIQCELHPKKAAKICKNVILSAKANAIHNNGLDETKLKVDQAWVGKGKYFKRTSIHGRGRSGIRHKYHSHLTVVLKEEETKRRTKIIPMMQERKKWWNIRQKYVNGGGGGGSGYDGEEDDSDDDDDDDDDNENNRK